MTGIAEAFLSGGVANFLGTHWPVGDDAASVFSRQLYETLLQGGALGEAVLAARQRTAALPSIAHDLPFDQPLRNARDAFERVYFEYHIAREGGNISRVAEAVGLERTHLYRKLKQLGIKLVRRSENGEP
jgi:DNA-binding NtrC family response regulator